MRIGKQIQNSVFLVPSSLFFLDANFKISGVHASPPKTCANRRWLIPVDKPHINTVVVFRFKPIGFLAAFVIIFAFLCAYKAK